MRAGCEPWLSALAAKGTLASPKRLSARSLRALEPRRRAFYSSTRRARVKTFALLCLTAWPCCMRRLMRLQLVASAATLVFITGMAGAYAAFVPAGGSAIEIAPPPFQKEGYFDARPCSPGWDRNTPGHMGPFGCVLSEKTPPHRILAD